MGVAGTSGVDVEFSPPHDVEDDVYVSMNNCCRLESFFLRHDFLGMNVLNMSSSRPSSALLALVDLDGGDDDDDDDETLLLALLVVVVGVASQDV